MLLSEALTRPCDILSPLDATLPAAVERRGTRETVAAASVPPTLATACVQLHWCRVARERATSLGSGPYLLLRSRRPPCHSFPRLPPCLPSPARPLPLLPPPSPVPPQPGSTVAAPSPAFPRASPARLDRCRSFPRLPPCLPSPARPLPLLPPCLPSPARPRPAVPCPAMTVPC